MKNLAIISFLIFLGCTNSEPNLDHLLLPEVITTDITGISRTTAISGGEIVSDGGESVTDRGIVWSESPSPTIASFKTSDGAGGGKFVSTMTDLNPNTSYFVRAYATNSNGTSYGLTLNFKTSSISIVTMDITDITGHSAVSGGQITSNGVETIIAKGVVWSKTQYPTIDDYKTSDGSGDDSFTSTLSNLQSNTTYFVRAYLTTSSEIIYGLSKSFETTISIEDFQLGKLSKTWSATSVKLDNVDQTGYDNFVLTISGTAGSSTFGYSVTGRPVLGPWLSSGQWKFGASPETQIIRDSNTGDELDMTYSVTDTQLQITFTFTGDGYSGRVSNVKGQWVFTFQ